MAPGFRYSDSGNGTPRAYAEQSPRANGYNGVKGSFSAGCVRFAELGRMLVSIGFLLPDPASALSDF